MMHRFRNEINDLSERVNHVESKMGKFPTSFNNLVNTYTEKEEEIDCVKVKLADLEERSRQNNVKIRGITETIQPTALKNYFVQLMAVFLWDTSQADLIIDHIHRLPKPAHLPDMVPWDTIVCVHFFNVKEELMIATRNTASYPQLYADLSFFNDLSQFTMMRRKSLSTITNHHITYKWDHPVKLVATKDKRTYNVRTLEEGLSLVRKWKILHPPDQPASRTQTRHRAQPDWKDGDPLDKMCI